MNTDKMFLFICGVGRSGTTALCEVLNLHEKVVLGIERYKYRMIGASFPENPIDLFDKRRFFDYQPEDTNVRMDSKEYGAVYENAKSKFESAVYVGDKTPGLYKKLPALRAGFPGCKVIYIFRDPAKVAFSWHNRAAKGRENWPEKNGYEASILEWNRSLKIIERAIPEWSDDLILVDYGTTFGTDALTLFPELLDRLRLGTAMNSQIKEFLGKSIDAAGRDRKIPPQIVAHVEKNANYSLYEHLIAENK